MATWRRTAAIGALLPVLGSVPFAASAAAAGPHPIGATHRAVAAAAESASDTGAQRHPAAAYVHHPRVLRVGRWHGVKGNEPSIAAAVRDLRPHDWLLIGPGDWRPRMDYSRAQRKSDFPAAVNVTTPHVWIRGMNRRRVVIDGTRRGPACSPKRKNQDFGPKDSSGAFRGRNGIDALFADGVHIDNLTACNFLSGSADSGNEIWWNGGDDGGKIGLGSWWGNYLSATSTYFDPKNVDSAAQYGLFVSNSNGPGVINHSYASNFSDSGYYVGACPNCRAVLRHAHSEYNALGYSGTNSGGTLVVERSTWDHNKTGFVTNSQNSADPPSPQDGTCAAHRKGPRGTGSCWVFRHNVVRDNNDPNVPAIGDAAIGPVGGGIVIAGGRFDTIAHNRFVHNGSWAVLTTLFPDTGSENSHNISNCHGGVAGATLPAELGGLTVPCLFDVWGNRVVGNTFSHNGFYGNQTNGDIADLSIPPAESPGAPADCARGNQEAGGGTVSTWPPSMATTQANCHSATSYPDPASSGALLTQVACATQAFYQCPSAPGMQYPRLTKVVMHPLPRQKTMPNPCAGVPRNPWCPRHRSTGGGGGY